MMQLGYDEVARVCLSHSFNDQSLADYVGNRDTTPEETALIESALASMVYDEYDRLIQLCDSLAGAEGVLDIECQTSLWCLPAAQMGYQLGAESAF